jgi:hypothetical protein
VQRAIPHVAARDQLERRRIEIEQFKRAPASPAIRSQRLPTPRVSPSDPRPLLSATLLEVYGGGEGAELVQTATLAGEFGGLEHLGVG